MTECCNCEKEFDPSMQDLDYDMCESLSRFLDMNSLCQDCLETIDESIQNHVDNILNSSL